MPNKIGLLLAATACVATLGATSLPMHGSVTAARAAEEMNAGPIVVAQANTRAKAQSSRRRGSSSFAIQGAAPGWPNGIPVGGGQAAQDAAGPVPDAGPISGPSFSGPSVNW